MLIYKIKINKLIFLDNLGWIVGVGILVAVLVVVFFTAFIDWRSERQFRRAKNKFEKDRQTSAIRDNSIQQIPISELVVGDLCFIKHDKINLFNIDFSKKNIFLQVIFYKLMV
jgi:magnesium-transporting ATPase (P-type)